MKVLFINNILSELKIPVLSPIEFPESPIVGDIVDIKSYLSVENQMVLDDHLNNSKSNILSVVVGRTWRIFNGENALFLLLEIDQSL